MLIYLTKHNNLINNYIHLEEVIYSFKYILTINSNTLRSICVYLNIYKLVVLYSYFLMVCI